MINTATGKKLMTKREVTEKLRISICTLDRWMRDGKIPYIKLGGCKVIRFDPDDIELWLKAWKR